VHRVVVHAGDRPQRGAGAPAVGGHVGGHVGGAEGDVGAAVAEHADVVHRSLAGQHGGGDADLGVPDPGERVAETPVVALRGAGGDGDAVRPRGRRAGADQARPGEPGQTGQPDRGADHGAAGRRTVGHPRMVPGRAASVRRRHPRRGAYPGR